MTISDPTRTPGLCLLVVEDEALVAMMLESLLTDLGCSVIGPAASVKGALALLKEGDGAPDAAVLDINLGTENVFPVAEALVARGIPFAFVTGYGPTAVGPNSPLAGVPVLAKPFHRRQLQKLIAELAALRAKT